MTAEQARTIRLTEGVPASASTFQVIDMHHRIHECMDGERAREELSAEESRELAALEAAIGSVSDSLRDGAAPDLSARVMARVAEIRSQPSRLERAAAATRRSLDWLVTPWPLQVRPVYGVTVLTMAVFLLVLAPPPSRDVPPAGSVERPIAHVYVQFRLEAPGASHVALAGNFTGWQPEYELRETRSGTWSILLPLQPGIHDYAFVVDGVEWVADPHALRVADGFGGMNSRIALPSPPMGLLES